MNVALPWLLLVGRKPIIATRGVNPFFMLQLRCATFRFPLSRITHAPTPAEQVHRDGARDEHAVLPIMEEGPATLPSEIEKLQWHDRQDDNDLAERRRRSACKERGRSSLAQPHSQARYSILSSV
jgi:hypothetical protein